MKKLFVLGLALLTLTVSGSAQVEKPALYIGAGLSVPLNPDIISDGWKTGFNSVAACGFKVHPKFELVAKVGYSAFSFDEDGIRTMLSIPSFASDVNITGGTAKALEVTTDVKFLLPMGGVPVDPYLVGGVGLAYINVPGATIGYPDSTTTLPANEETKLAFGAGAGFTYMFSSKVGLFAEGKYMHVLTSDDYTAYAPMRIGFRYSLGE